MPIRLAVSLGAAGLALAVLTAPSSPSLAATYEPNSKCWGYKDHNPVWICKPGSKAGAVKNKASNKTAKVRKYSAYPYRSYPTYAPYFYDYPPPYYDYPYPYPYEFTYPYGYYPYGYRHPFSLFFGFGPW